MTAVALRITYPNGQDVYLRRGARIGAGPIVKFTSRTAAEFNRAFIAEGLDSGTTVAIVPFSQIPKEEQS